jgi:hypothetical protein
MNRQSLEIICTTIKTGIFPSCVKKTMFKTGTTDEVGNYRSMTPVQLC